MQYFALLISKERDRTPEEGAAEMAAYQSFHVKAASAIRGGDALRAGGDRGTHHRRPGRAGHHRRPVRRRRRSSGRLLRVRSRKPRRGTGAGPRHPGGQARRRGDLADGRRPGLPPQPLAGTNWIALLLEPPERPRPRPARRSGRRWWFSTESSALRRASTSWAAPACTRRRPRPPCGCATARSSSPTGHTWKAPRSPTASMCSAPSDRDEAVKIASMIPASTVQLRQLAGVAGL